MRSLNAGFLTRGDGGALTASFWPAVSVGASLFLVFGEVGGQAGEGLSSSSSLRPRRSDRHGVEDAPPDVVDKTLTDA